MDHLDRLGRGVRKTDDPPACGRIHEPGSVHLGLVQTVSLLARPGALSHRRPMEAELPARDVAESAGNLLLHRQDSQRPDPGIDGGTSRIRHQIEALRSRDRSGHTQEVRALPPDRQPGFATLDGAGLQTHDRREYGTTGRLEGGRTGGGARPECLRGCLQGTSQAGRGSGPGRKS